MNLVFLLVALGLANVKGLLLGRVLPPVLARAQPRTSLHIMQSELPITSTSSLAEMRALIAERGLDVKTTGKGRTKEVIFKELVALCSSAEGCEASEDAMKAEMATAPFNLPIASVLVNDREFTSCQLEGRLRLS